MQQIQRTTLHTHEAAEYLGVSKDTIYRWVKSEGLPCLKLANGRKMLFKTKYIDAWIEKRMNIDQQFDDKYEQEYGNLRILKP